MGLRQIFRFSAQSETLVEACLRSLGKVADLDEERESFVFTNKTDEPSFQFHCMIVQGGIDTDRSGAFFTFLGVFEETLSREFGQFTIDDAQC